MTLDERYLTNLCCCILCSGLELNWERNLGMIPTYVFEGEKKRESEWFFIWSFLPADG